MNRSLFSVLLTVVVISSSAISVNAAESASELSGKDYVSIGKLDSLSGTLFEKDGEWYLTVEHETYDLHFGNETYRNKIGINLKAGAVVAVTGYVYEKNVSVCTITLGGKEYRFRKDDGTPMWTGQGNGRNTTTDSHE
jgi:hypothetical protein